MPTCIRPLFWISTLGTIAITSRVLLFFDLDTLAGVSSPLRIHSGFSVLALFGFHRFFRFCFFLSHKFIPLSRAGGT
jgi:hypothetical protein